MFSDDNAREAVANDRAMLANAMAEDLDYIAIVEGSASAVVNPLMRKRLVLIGGVKNEAEAREQLRRKTSPWERVERFCRLQDLANRCR